MFSLIISKGEFDKTCFIKTSFIWVFEITVKGVSMFEMWKLLLKQADQTGPYKFLTYFHLTETIVNNNERIDEVTLFDTSWQKQIYIYIYTS